MNPFDMMKNLKNIQEKMQAAQAKIQTFEAEGSAGGGLVKVTIDGTFKVKSTQVDPSLANADDFPMLGDLFVAASKDAHAKIAAMIQKEMEAATGGMPLPPMFGMGM